MRISSSRSESGRASAFVAATAISAIFFFVSCSSGSSGANEAGGAIQNNQLSSVGLDSIVPTLGDSGSQVTIFGASLLPDTVETVKFGSVVAFIEEFDAQGLSMKVRVPAQPIGFSNPSPITVTLKDGTKDSLFPGYFYQNNSDCTLQGEFPDIISVDPINVVIDNEFTVHGVNFDIGALVMVQNQVTPVVEVNSTTIVATLPSGLAQQCSGLSCQIEIRVANENGCIDSIDALGVIEGDAVEYNYPNLGNNMMGTALAAANQSIDDLTDTVPDFANLTAENLIMHSGDSSLSSPIWSRSLTSPTGSSGDLPCYQPKFSMDNRLRNVGDMDGDGFNDFSVSQSIIVDSYPNPFLSDNRICFISGKGIPFDDIYVPSTSTWGYNVEGAGSHILIARNFWLNGAPAIATSDRVDICTASNLADGNPNNNCTAPYGSIAAGSVGESVNGFGQAMLSLGDIDGDGSVEFVVSAPSASVTVGGDKGKLFLYSVEDVKNGMGFRNRAVAAFDTNGLGSNLARVGDFDEDGIDDFVAVANGRIVGYSSLEFNDNSTSPSPLFILSGYRTNTGGINPFGTSYLVVASAGDVNGDGHKDFIVGDSNFSAAPNMAPAMGRTVVYSGKLSADGTPLELFGRDSVLTSERLGASVAGIGDVNGDGFDDVVTGGPRLQPNIVSTVYLFNMWSPTVNYAPLP